jgi:hypothetical protein
MLDSLRLLRTNAQSEPNRSAVLCQTMQRRKKWKRQAIAGRPAASFSGQKADRYRATLARDDAAGEAPSIRLQAELETIWNADPSAEADDGPGFGKVANHARNAVFLGVEHHEGQSGQMPDLAHPEAGITGGSRCRFAVVGG